MKFFFTMIIATVSFVSVSAQSAYIMKGKIEYEKTVNTFKVLEDNWNGSDKTMLEAFKKTMQPTGTSYFDLYFNADRSLYKPGKDVVVTQRPPDWVNGPANDNIIFNDLARHLSTAQKNVFENTYLIQDSLKTLNWKITNDTRHDCRIGMPEGNRCNYGLGFCGSFLF